MFFETEDGIEKMHISAFYRVFGFILCLFVCIYTIGCSAEVFVSQRPPSHAVISIEEDLIDLGKVPFESDYIRAKIKFKNVGSEELKVLNVSGPCSCFAGYSGDDRLGKGQSGELDILFDKSYLPVGEQTRVINILTNDPVNKVCKVIFRFTIPAYYSKNDIRVFPAVLDYGRFYKTQFNREFSVTIIFPDTANNYDLDNMKVATSTELLLVNLTEDSIVTNDSDNEYSRIYRLSWQEIPTVYFEEEVVFSVTDLKNNNQKKVSMHVRGEAVTY